MSKVRGGNRISLQAGELSKNHGHLLKLSAVGALNFPASAACPRPQLPGLSGHRRAPGQGSRMAACGLPLQFSEVPSLRHPIHSV